MLITERQLKKIIKALLLEQGPDIPERPEISGSKFGVPVTNVEGDPITKTDFRRSQKKIKEVIVNNFKDAVSAYKRKLYSNDLTNKVRNTISDALPDTVKAITGYDKNQILNYIIPKDREQRFKNVTDKKDPYYLNGYPDIVKTIEQSLDNVKLGLDFEVDAIADKYTKKPSSFGSYSSEKNLASINTKKFFNIHVGKDCLKKKLSLIFDEYTKNEKWNNFDTAVRGTIFHEMSHAWDEHTTPEGYDIIDYLAKECLKRYDELYPSSRNKISNKETKRQYTNETLEGSQKIKNILVKILKKEHHECYKDPSIPPSLQKKYKCTYLNASSRGGQTEILTRIRQAKTEVPGSSQGVGKFNAENIKFIKNNLSKARHDVRQLFNIIKKDVDDQLIADTFNKLIPSG